MAYSICMGYQSIFSLGDDQVDNFVQEYIHDSFCPEVHESIARFFEILSRYYNEDRSVELVNLLTTAEDMHSEDLHDQISSTIINMALDVLTAHGLTMSKEHTFYEFNQILDGLWKIQNLEDYTEIITILESTDDNLEKVSEIISLNSELSVTETMTLLQDSNVDRFIPRITIMAHDKMLRKPDSPVTFDIEQLKQIKRFRTMVEPLIAVGVRMIESGFPIGLPLASYIPFAKSSLDTDDIKELSIHIFSLLLISQGGYEAPQVLFKNSSYFFAFELEKATKIDIEINKIIADLSKIKYKEGDTKTTLDERGDPTFAKG